MKIISISLLISILICGCSGKNEPATNAKYESPSDVVLGYINAMMHEDSTTIINSLSKLTKEKIIAKLDEVGGFKRIFEVSKGMKYDIKILKVDSVSEDHVKVYTKQTIEQDSSIHIKLDSMYFTLHREDGFWKMSGLSARKD